MYNIINIIEDGNKIYLGSNYPKIICGNTNYYLKFTFDNEWSEVENKTAVFEVLGKKIFVEFKGDICNIPCMPNASYFLVSITCSPDKDKSYCSNSIKLELEKNSLNEELQLMDPFISYYSRLKRIVDEIEEGTLSVKHADTSEKSLTQVSKNGDETIYGYKNFSNRITQNGLTVANLSDISNPNYIINPNMIINQRTKRSYSGINTYGTDRWKLKSEYSFIRQNQDLSWSVGIENALESNERYIISQTIEKVEPFKGKTVTASFQFKDIDETISNTTCLSIYDGVTRTETLLNHQTKLTTLTKTISQNATTLEIELKTNGDGENVTIKFDWCKLEIGSFATMFVPRLYTDELSLCQRYYQYIYLTGNGCSYSNTGSIYCPISLPVTLYKKPTAIIYEKPIIVGNSTSFDASEVLIQSIKNNVCMITCRSGSNGVFVENNIYAIYDGVVALDAEIY